MAKNKIKLDIGTIYQKEEKGIYYFRYQVNGQRKAVSLKTKNQKDAIKKAESYVPTIKATSHEVISAHVKEARRLTDRKKLLLLSDAWDTYSKHPDRATPATVHEQKSYKATLQEFFRFVNAPDGMAIRDITPAITNEFADHLRTTAVSVTTHNRKIKRLRKIFDTLKEYCDLNPFAAPSIRRKPREEQELNVRRISFTKEQEQKILEVLGDPKYKVMHKSEIRVIYYLGMFTGQRLKDCVLLRWDKLDMERRKIWVKQFKTAKEVTIPMSSKLLPILEEALKWKKNEYVCPNVAKRYKQTDRDGKVVGDNHVNHDVMRVIRWTGLEPSVEVPGRKRKVTVYGFHSLRHSFASHCAEAGVPKAVLLSILGTDSSIADKYYTHIGDEAQEKAIAAISGDSVTLSDRKRIEDALALIRSGEGSPMEILAQVEKILSN
jgi:integrase